MSGIPEGIPRLLANVAFETNKGDDHVIDYGLSCKSCGGKAFQVLSFPKTVSETDDFYGLTPGETIFRPPHKLICAACGSGGLVFDPRKDGYDAILNGVCAYEAGEDGEKPAPGKYHITISLAYNGELSELKESAADAGVSTADLFDWITITASPTTGGDPLIFDYECA